MAPRPPSKRWYRVAWAFVGVGLLAAVAWWPYATNRVFDAVEGFVRTAPFGGRVELASPGTHTFWIEGTCMSCHDNDPSEYRAVATVRVEDPEGRPIPLRPAPARVYNTSRREGRSLWLFDVTTPGPHRVSLDLETSGEEWDNVLPDDIAIGSGRGLPVGIVRPMALFAMTGIVAGGQIAAVTVVRRRRYFAIPYEQRG
jgi:hypothetical protein